MDALTGCLQGVLGRDLLGLVEAFWSFRVGDYIDHKYPTQGCGWVRGCVVGLDLSRDQIKVKNLGYSTKTAFWISTARPEDFKLRIARFCSGWKSLHPGKLLNIARPWDSHWELVTFVRMEADASANLTLVVARRGSASELRIRATEEVAVINA